MRVKYFVQKVGQTSELTEKGGGRKVHAFIQKHQKIFVDVVYHFFFGTSFDMIHASISKGTSNYDQRRESRFSLYRFLFRNITF